MASFAITCSARPNRGPTYRLGLKYQYFPPGFNADGSSDGSYDAPEDSIESLQCEDIDRPAKYTGYRVYQDSFLIYDGRHSAVKKPLETTVLPIHFPPHLWPHLQ